MNRKKWEESISHRSDFTCGLVHLTKPKDKSNSLDILTCILKEKVLKASTGFISGNDPVVCFQDVPLESLSENIYYEQKLRDKNKSEPFRYSPIGLRFSKPYIYRNGGRPVFYENTDTAKKILPQNEYWRIVDLDLSDDKNYIDWMHEREWRIKGDFHFDLDQVEILLSKEYSLARFIEHCNQIGLGNVLNEVKGIVTLKSIIF